MASQKEKYLSSAQKWIQKGQVDRAIKDYEQIVAMDPKDVRHRQKLAELLARCNRNEDAVREYETIARFYEDNGFYLKAIALYKQIQKLDSGRMEISLTLAALNEKHGLIGNALSEYKYVFDNYEKEGNKSEACKILERMHAVDPDNIDIRLKLAETYFTVGRTDEAYQEYTRAALILKSRGNESVFDKVCNRIQSLFPEKKEFLLDLVEEQLKSGTDPDVVRRLKHMLADDEKNHKVLSLYAEACKRSGDTAERKYACEKLLQHFPEDAAGKEGLIECTVEEGNMEDCLKIIDLYASDLIAAGLFGSLEKFYTALQSQAPYDTRILEGLKALYVATGDTAKLADVQVSLKILSGDGSGETSAPKADAGGKTETASSSDEFSEGMDVDFAWDDGIDLSVSADEPEETSNVYELNIDDMEMAPDFMENGDELPIAMSGEVSENDHDVEDQAQEPAETGDFHDLLDLDLGDTLLEVEFEEAAELEVVEEIPEPEPDREEVPVEQPEGDWLSMDLSVEPDVDADKSEAVVASSEDKDLPGMEDYSLESELSEPEIKTEEPLDEDETEARFNLGIAYKEMGLYDEAMKEFIAAAANPLRTIDCLILQGICLGEMGDTEKAEEILTHGMDRFKQEPEKSLNLKYELGLLYEASGRKEDALHVFRDVFAVNPGFRDTAGKIAKLHGSGDLPDFSDIDEVDFKLERIV